MDENEQAPPNNIPAEQALLGLLLLNNDALLEAVDIVTPGDFYRPAHGVIYQGMVTLSTEGKPFDPVILSDYLRADLSRIGGAVYLASLLQAAGGNGQASYYARIIHEKAVLRHLSEVGQRINQAATSAMVESGEILELAEREIRTVSDTVDNSNEVESIDSLTDRVLQGIKDSADSGQRSVLTGFAELDELTGGFRPGEMIIVAGRPGSGKSTLAMDFARYASIITNKVGLLFTLEMSGEETMNRLLSAEADVRLSHLRNSRNMTDEDWTRLRGAAEEVRNAPLYIQDTPFLTPLTMRATARKWKQRYGLDYMALDYLQLLKSGEKAESRQQEVSEMSRSLKLLAKELEVPVIVLCQLNRGPEQRIDKKPMVSDLRESGSLEQDADMVLLVHRPDAYDVEDRPGEADIIVGKNRAGRVGTLSVAHQLHMSRFRDFPAVAANYRAAGY